MFYVTQNSFYYVFDYYTASMIEFFVTVYLCKDQNL